MHPDRRNFGAIAEASPRAQAPVDVDILSIACATPRHKVAQHQVAAFMKELFPQHAHLEEIYANCGVETRYLCEPPHWYLRRHGWEERNQLFLRHALDLLEEVARSAIAGASLGMRDIDALVTQTSTGIAVPSLDALLLNRMDLAHTVERLPIFGLACGGGLGALARATRIAQGMPGGNILCLTVDLMTLCLDPDDARIESFAAGALFGDGAAGVLLRKAGEVAHRPLVRIQILGEHFWRDTERHSGLDIKDHGMALVLSKDVHRVAQKEFGPAIMEFLHQHDLRLEDFEGFLFHPGAIGVLRAIQESLGLDRTQLRHSWDVLREYGHMSSATVLFILERAIKAGCRGRHLLFSVGPGLSVYLAVAVL
jgi:alkylresorcinol/alkylpyrone synthase